MSNPYQKTIAIVGAGPTGNTLACLLIERGYRCIVFDDQRTPDLLVGESLVPAAIPIIRRLGIEDQVAAISNVKKGAALRHGANGVRVDFTFRDLGNGVSDYAYNIPRPSFDKIVRNRAESLGAQFVNARANIQTTSVEGELRLTADSLTAAGLNESNHPDLLIDATGRSRLFSRTLGLKPNRGPRNDVAHFAHFKNFPCDSKVDGQVVITVLERGWSWQIPLNDDVTSVGVVLNSDAAASYGDSAEERLENVLDTNSALNKPKRERVSEVKTYANYQLMARQSHGPGWALVGDALGFVDPMLSPGVFLAMESAIQLDQHVFAKPSQEWQQGFDTYFKEMQRWNQAWSTLIEYFYDGRMLGLGAMRPDVPASESRFSIRKVPDMLVSAVLSRLVSGARTRSAFYQKVLFQLCKLLTNQQVAMPKYAIRNDKIDLAKATAKFESNRHAQTMREQQNDAHNDSEEIAA